MLTCSKMIRNGFVLLLFMLFRYEIFFLFLPVRLWRILYFTIAIIYLLKNYPIFKSAIQKIDYSNSLGKSFLLYIISIFYGFIIVVACDGEFSYYQRWIINLWESLVIYCFLVLLIRNLISKTNLMEMFMRYFIVSQCVYVLSSIMFILNPELKHEWLKLIFQPEGVSRLLEYAGYITRFGLRGYAGFVDTIDCSIGVVFSSYLYFTSRKTSYLVFVFIMLLGNFFYGRSGLIFSMSFIILYCIKRISWRRVIFLIGFFFMVSAFLNVLLIITNNDHYLEYALKWVLQPFESFYKAASLGEFSLGRSGDIMLKMYFLPNDILTLIFGDGKFTNLDQSYYMHVDVGYMRRMLFFGVIGEVISYASFSYLLLCLYSLLKKSGHNKEIILFIVFLVLFFEFKGTPMDRIFGLVYALCIAQAIGKDITRKTILGEKDL